MGSFICLQYKITQSLRPMQPQPENLRRFGHKKGVARLELTPCFFGAGGENRTHKGLRPADFESAAFTYFTTPAIKVAIYSKEPAMSNVKLFLAVTLRFKKSHNFFGAYDPFPKNQGCLTGDIDHS